MTINEIKELIQLIDQTSINDFQYQKDGYKIKIKKTSGEIQSNSAVQTGGATYNAPVKQVVGESLAGVNPQESVSAAAQESRHLESEVQVIVAAKSVEGKEVKSPLVGVYYASPSPTSPAFIQVGSAVKKGDVLCIVEAMKIMNEIVAEHDGVVTEICAENETLVEYGQTLVKIG